MVHAVYPGSFDPLHNGHLDIIRRASSIYDHLTVAVIPNPLKQTKTFTVEERRAIVEATVKDMTNVSVDQFHGLLANYMDTIGARVIVKGLRAISDFESELEMAHLNRQLNRKVETTFIMTATRWSFVSSSRIKEIARLGADVSKLVPKASLEVLREKFPDAR